MIKAEKIRKAYGTLEVLQSIDLAIDQGEVVSIVGASGAGKTTLLQILGTLERPSSGKVLYDDEDVMALPDRKLAAFRNKNIGFVFQFHQLMPEFTALENAALPAMIGSASKEEAFNRSSKLLEFLGLKDRKEHKPSELSGGEQQRVAVARSLVNNPKVVFADEPSGNLDSKNAKELHELFFRLRDEMGQTFVIVTHNEELAAMADRMLTIEDGIIQKP